MPELSILGKKKLKNTCTFEGISVKINSPTVVGKDSVTSSSSVEPPPPLHPTTVIPNTIDVIIKLAKALKISPINLLDKK